MRAVIFTFLILIAVLITKSDQDDFRKTSFQENIQDTSLTVPAKSVFVTPTKTRRIQDLAKVDQALFNISNLIKVPRRKSGVALPDLQTKSALVQDLGSNTNLLELNSSVRWPIASLTKLMTAVIAKENVGLEKQILITEKAWNTEGTAGNFQIGEVYKNEDLIKAMLVVSSNDAAMAIAEFYGEDVFLEAMRKKAEKLRLTQVNFADPTGLSFLNQSSINDLAKLVKYILKNHPELLDISRQKTVELLEISAGQKKTLTNINFFADWPDFLGGKTGFIDASSGNLIAIFNHKNYKILIIVLGTEDRYGQTELLYNWVKQAYSF